MSESQYCVIVDGYSAGNLLAPEFSKRGLSCIHVQSTPEILPLFIPSYRPDDYQEHLAFTGDIKKLIDELIPFNPLCILPGTETGVELADFLSYKFETPNNGYLKSEARRDKYLMVEMCRNAGLSVAHQFKSSNEIDIIQWMQQQSLSKVVVKPLKSAGTDNVFICTTTTEVSNAFKQILSGPNMLGIANDEVLIQEYLEGTEYFIDCVSCQGQHHFTDIWRYQKRSINGADCVYDNNTLCPSNGVIERVLQEYVRQVLMALDIQFGPTHTEVIMTAQGPRLVEIGARLDGLSYPAINQKAIGYSPVEVTVDAYLDPESFYKTATNPYPLLKHAKTLYLTSYEDGIIESIPGVEKLKSLRSFFNLKLRASTGSKIVRMTNYFTTPGLVWLVHENPDILENELLLIRRWESEKDHFFKINCE